MDFKGIVDCDHVVGSPTVKYTLQNCPRCFGTGKYGGVFAYFDMETVDGEQYLTQAIQKILISNSDERGYGFDYSLLSTTITPTTTTIIKREILRCLNYLQTVQQLDKRRGVKYLPNEEISRIGEIEVIVDPFDPRKITAKVAIYTISGNQIKISAVLKK